MLEEYKKLETLKALVKESKNKLNQYEQSVREKLDAIDDETGRLQASVKEKNKQFLQAEMSGNDAQTKAIETSIAELKKRLEEQSNLRNRYTGVNIRDMMDQDADRLLSAIKASRDERLAALEKYGAVLTEAELAIKKATQWRDDVWNELQELSRESELYAAWSVINLLVTDEEMKKIQEYSAEGDRNNIVARFIFR